MKYIIFESGGLEFPILFPDFIEHNRVSAKFGDNKPVSAGYVMSNFDGILRCVGDSITLELKSRPEDANLIYKHLRNQL